mmetsp:Transcript_26191/g.38729  ORF Transcript_26191/g.38729 Transcript_26191/m.38729 type:complete len:169 (+) Transcript_26191:51-557(+)
MAKKKGRSKRKDPPVVEDQNLERFAGSSDEEDEDTMPAGDKKSSDVESSRSEDMDSDLEEKGPSIDILREKPDQQLEEVEEVEKVEEVEEDADDGNAPISGMANAMARILGTQVKHSSASAVLAKTVTPLQRMAKEEKKTFERSARKTASESREKAHGSAYSTVSSYK